MTAQQAYQELIKEVKEISILGSCASVLGWDERTYMPRQGAEHRSNQLGLIARLSHERFTSSKIGDLLAKSESDGLKAGDTPEAANLREIRHQYDKATKLPSDLVEEMTKTTSLAQGKWAEARAKSDFKAFQPWLEKIVAIEQKVADAYGWKGERYNALLDNYEPGATVDDIASVFEKLRGELVTLLQKIKNAPKKPDVSIIEREYNIEMQRVFGESVAEAMGFDFAAGRLDITTHPFCSGFGPGDTRITTRYNPRRLNDALFGIMHEAGHALYEMGIQKAEYFGEPMGEAASLGIHESQSRMWENQVGRSKEFWVYFLPQAKRIFRPSLDNVSLDAFYGAVNYVTPSYIRVEADEATYNLHILLRFEIERAMLTGDLKPADVAHEWNSRFEKYFGLKVDNDANGCLQDVHWSAGYIGYFPTYTLGNLYSAQFFAKARQDMPNLGKQFEQGNYAELLAWLRKNIHMHGQRYRATDLVKRVTGQPLSAQPLVDYMNKKYGEIYGF